MPCFLTQRVEVDLSKIDSTFVNEALKGLEGVKHFLPGAEYTVVNLEDGTSVTYSNGKLTIQARSVERTTAIENEVKRGISNAVIAAAGKRFHWTLTKPKVNDYVVQKRGF